MNDSELILYQTDDGQAQVQLRATEGSVWLSQLAMAELFATSVPNVNIHIRNILNEHELQGESVIKESLTTAADGKNCDVFLEQAELRAKERQILTLDFWRQNVDRLLEFNDRSVLTNAGSISAEEMKAIAAERYDTFDTHRRAAEAVAADAQDIGALEAIENEAKQREDGE
ncbi:MAG: hypothetical protein HN742_35050 [Lentisphaerae bacterium]|jgi:hypothetical protein|nr:hypothetical protein [Lentisphaerota bacterium]MBT4816516.1 hypothetical protein [Lentisphaerota bacterium]MBT5609212.1 hypothetical protein [Lentisphaerota bacterium]MBT7060050.1 hypothetical protein [Lentisphaerota bacterium]MBT7847142.1 hypothetical protein [Lentisphaerota bacterium]